MALNQSATALVTGAGHRLGRAMALMLAEAGWSLIVHYNHSASAAEEVVHTIQQKGGHAIALGMDLTRIDKSNTFIDQARQVFGPITCLINNASIFSRDDFASVTSESWHAHMNINLMGPVFLSKAFATALPSKTEGCIVNILDQKLLRLTPDYFSYTVSKAGLWAVTRLLAIELAPYVRVNGIAPGLTLPSDGQTDAQFERVAIDTLLHRGPSLEDITRALAFILDTPCLTGQMILLDGGKHLMSRSRTSSLFPEQNEEQ